MISLTLKMLSEILNEMGLPQVTIGPKEHELMNIDYARKIYNMTNLYRSLSKAFMSVSSISFIAWPVGQHNDHFDDDGES